MQEDSPVQNENTPDTDQTAPSQRTGRRNRLIVLAAAALVALGATSAARSRPAPRRRWSCPCGRPCDCD
ncbi:hypothetical protein ABZ749_20630, partial [Micromonospora sp. NPDC047753]